MKLYKTFSELGELVSEAVEKAGEKKLGKNPKGDTTLLFDQAAEKTAKKFLEKNFGEQTVYGEESGKKTVKDAEFFFVIDPCDGSRNRLRGIPVYSFSIAMGKNGGKNTLEDVFTGYVKNLVNGDEYFVRGGKKPTLNGKKISTSKTKKLSKALLCLGPYEKKIIPVLEKTYKTRQLGTSAYETCLVSSAKIDAYVNLRGNWTIENYAAAQLIVREAGGVATSLKGKQLFNSPLNLTYKTTAVVSANEKLHEEIISTISGVVG